MRKALTFYVSRITPVAVSLNVDLAIRNPNPDPNPIYIAVATNGSSPIRMKTSRGHVGAGSRFRQASNVMRHELTFHVLRLTFVGASLNVVLMISILILIRILFTKQPTQVASATPARR